ncbi:AN1-type zinc finger protein 1 [Wickerhamomyces ciferrii]|uniref:AN1-type zinc finger protein 1 n=1 Tax=Wickerhamomyces ciferrii (strain ATCC 14091 / BCRC 22168 / CBS 111 / JCM 3599 / NBRC 0793 / NRRL Y-1031 F-60-10) TaxID=1206466 RepID=K0KNV1_WICCF|nr:AN1-type zinc finger protein 1 [Wickerhamomyces ciferrii]CCH46955.1 AN1-type zinc finger protein 1 [Wickerhamomyces ciferrii]
MTQLLDIGEHCSFCGQIDFLPFKCSCHQTFCQNHRKPENHDCKDWKLKQKQQKPTEIHENSFKDLPSSQSLFPDRSNWKPPTLKTTETNPTNLQGTLKSNSNALNKLKKFFTKSSKSIKPSKNPSKKIIELAQLKNKSKGDPKVPTTERIHLQIQVIDESSNIDQNTKFPIFISRSWPIGRALDSIASNIGLKNLNNRTNNPDERIFLFKLIDNDFIKLNTSDRCSGLKDGDNLFIVRGSDPSV